MRFFERISSSLVVSLSLCLGGALALQGRQPPEPEIADIIYADPGSYPIFVAADLAFENRGVVSIEEYTDGLRGMVERLFKKHAVPANEDCVPVPTEEPIAMRRDARASRRASSRGPLGQLEEADFLVIGEVVEARAGFWSYHFGTLLRVRKTGGEWSALSEAAPTPDLVFIPSGEHVTGRQKLCLSDVRFSRVPLVGERIVVMVENSPNYLRGRFLSPLGPQLIILPNEGPSVLSPDFQKTKVKASTGDLSVPEVIRHVESEVTRRAAVRRAN